jgi:hypothetical protein
LAICGGRELRLLDALLLSVPANQGVEDRQNMAAVFDHAVEDVAEFGVTLSVAVPLQQNGLRDLNVAPELFGRVAAQEKAIEKGRFPLGECEVCGDFGRNELGNRGHKENAVYRKASPRQEVRAAGCGEPDNAGTENGLAGWSPERFQSVPIWE